MADQSLAAKVARLERQYQQLAKGQRVAHGASIEDAALEVRDGAGSLRAIMGQQADGTSGLQVVNGPPPPQPSAPLVASVLGGVAVSWDGTFAGGEVLPLDWARLEVHASQAPGFTPDATTLQNTIETAQGATCVVATDVAVYVRTVARNTSGAASPASVEVGPTGPAPVVAQELLDGIVTEVKLANDAVTAAKIAAGAVGATEISDGAVSTPKLTAGAVQADQIAAGAVATDKLTAGAVTTAKIDALAVTADKLAVNSVTADKIQAGAVTATALSADAITGKTITGGVLQTATSGQRIVLNEASSNSVRVYDGTGRLVGFLDGTGLSLTGSTGALMMLDPNATFPQLKFSSQDGTRNAYVAVGDLGPQAKASLSLQSGSFTAGGVDWNWRHLLGGDVLVAERRRNSDNAIVGGRVKLLPTYGELSYTDTTNATVTTQVQVAAGAAEISNGRLRVTPPGDSNSGLYIQTTAAQTGAMLRLVDTVSGRDRFKVETSGNTTVDGVLTAGNIVTGSVNITPSAANTPTSAIITFNCTGTVFRGFVTAQSTVPAPSTGAGGTPNGVNGVSISGVSATGATVWVNRQNTTQTTVNWMVIGI